MHTNYKSTRCKLTHIFHATNWTTSRQSVNSYPISEQIQDAGCGRNKTFPRISSISHLAGFRKCIPVTCKKWKATRIRAICHLTMSKATTAKKRWKIITSIFKQTDQQQGHQLLIRPFPTAVKIQCARPRISWISHLAECRLYLCPRENWLPWASFR